MSPQPEVAAERRRRECARPPVPSAPPGLQLLRQQMRPLSPPSWSRSSRGPGGGGLRLALTLLCPYPLTPGVGGPLGDPPLDPQAPPGVSFSVGGREREATSNPGKGTKHNQQITRRSPGVYRDLRRTGPVLGACCIQLQDPLEQPLLPLEAWDRGVRIRT